jgi:transcriptional regulator with XRE-family HTH domain
MAIENEFESFGMRLAHGRKQQHLSQEELAGAYQRRFGPLDVMLLNDLEQDRIDPRTVREIIRGISEILGVALAELEQLALLHDSAVRRHSVEVRETSTSLLAFRRSR